MKSLFCLKIIFCCSLMFLKLCEGNKLKAIISAGALVKCTAESVLSCFTAFGRLCLCG